MRDIPAQLASMRATLSGQCALQPMALPTAGLARAREAASALLDALGLEAYLFAIEPREDAWELKVECAIDEGWQTTTLPVDIDLLLASRTDPDAWVRLAQSWGTRLAACRRRPARRF